jgi:hypothetical protein
MNGSFASLWINLQQAIILQQAQDSNARWQIKLFQPWIKIFIWLFTVFIIAHCKTKAASKGRKGPSGYGGIVGSSAENSL